MVKIGLLHLHPKVGDTVKFKWKQGKFNAVHTGIVTQKLGKKCAIMWTNYKGRWTVDRYTLKNDAAGIKKQRYWFGWPGIPAGTNMGPNVDAGGLVLDNHLNVTNACSKAPSACALNCRTIVEDVSERFPTPQDCVVNNWSSWSSCNKTCGGGVQSRSRGVKYQPKFGGKACPALDEKRMCNTTPCYPANYKGCYKDCQGRDLPTKVGNLTKNQCADKARELNKKYYGLQYQNGVGKGDKDLAECWLGNTYGKQEPKNSTGWAKCKNIGPANNTIVYGQSCSNAIYENKNYNPNAPKYTAQGNRYCSTYDGYARHPTRDVAECQKNCNNDANCNAIGVGSDCVTYTNCAMSTARQNWGFNYYTLDLPNIKNIGVNGRTNMGRCEGDCDKGQCGPGLTCYQRSGSGNRPPGCKGSVKSGWDYCVKCNESGKNVGKGESYRGCKNITKNGIECQKWTSQSPNRHGNTPAKRPNTGLGDHNMCRNPDNTSGGIWCYQTSGARWAYC